MELPDLNEMEDIFLTIEEEDGSETECQMICMFEYNENAYAALSPVDDTLNEAYLFAVTIENQEDEFEFTISNIEDDDLLEEVGNVFTSIMQQAAEAEADEDGDIPDISEDLKGVSIDTNANQSGESHERTISDSDDESYWDQFINKKLEDL
ncbi:MAG: DUF1292 domain-containing protein [Eubacterium sp.]|nr:DUF1292 domain-containing protein [Eubacterium sp.]